MAYEYEVAVWLVSQQLVDADRQPSVKLADCFAPRRGDIGVDHPPTADAELIGADDGLRHTLDGAQGTFAEPAVVRDGQAQRLTDW